MDAGGLHHYNIFSESAPLEYQTYVPTHYNIFLPLEYQTYFPKHKYSDCMVDNHYNVSEKISLC